jgi:hypothetical protein
MNSEWVEMAIVHRPYVASYAGPYCTYTSRRRAHNLRVLQSMCEFYRFIGEAVGTSTGMIPVHTTYYL